VPPPVRAAARFAIAYRPEREDDLGLLAALYASARGEAFAGLGWPPEMLAAFLDQQFRAQHAQYRVAYPAAEWLIVEADGAAAGRLAVERREASLHLIDIALVAERRGGGLGGAILADLIGEADALGLPVSLQVDQANPARRLYERLGFRTLEVRPPYEWMERPPGEGGG
jgi:ribosomal protein S18 acetylase RimI-like enzyme